MASLDSLFWAHFFVWVGTHWGARVTRRHISAICCFVECVASWRRGIDVRVPAVTGLILTGKLYYRSRPFEWFPT